MKSQHMSAGLEQKEQTVTHKLYRKESQSSRQRLDDSRDLAVKSVSGRLTIESFLRITESGSATVGGVPVAGGIDG